MKRLALLLVSLWFLWGVTARAGENTYDSRYATIHFSRPEQVEEVAAKIRPGALARSLNQIFLGKRTPPDMKLGKDLDRLFQRVQLILDMPRPKLRVHIKVCRDQEEVSREWAEAGGRSAPPAAFYRRETNTIYVSTERLTVGILAHEMGHAVIAHYFIVRPPTKIAEMLCQYVDKEVSRGNL